MFSIKTKQCPTRIISTGVTPHVFITQNGTAKQNVVMSSVSSSSSVICNSNSPQTTLKNDPYVKITNPRWGV